MPNESMTKKEEPLSVNERITEASIKAMEKSAKENTEQRLQSGESPQAILSALVQTLNQGQQQHQQSIIEDVGRLSQTPVPSATEGKYGLLAQLLTGGKIKSGDPVMEPLGATGALSVMQLQQKQRQDAFQNALDVIETGFKLNDEQRKQLEAMRKSEIHPLEVEQKTADIANAQYDLAKKKREDSMDYKIQEDLREVKNEIFKKEAITLHKSATDSLGAIDAFDSLTNSFYEGFDPISIEEMTGRPIDEATISDLFTGKMDAIRKMVEAKMGKNPKAAAFLRNVEAFSTLIARGGFQERGTLTDKDRKVVVRAFNLALANRENADVAFDTIRNVLSKPALRYAKMKVSKFKAKLKDVDLPFNLKEKALAFQEANPDVTDMEILSLLEQRANKVRF